MGEVLRYMSGIRQDVKSHVPGANGAAAPKAASKLAAVEMWSIVHCGVVTHIATKHLK